MGSKDSWGFAEGDPITAELSALKLLGGGSAFEAWLAFDEITFSAVVVQGPASLPGRGRVLPARPAPGGLGPRRDQPSRGRPRVAWRRR